MSVQGTVRWALPAAPAVTVARPAIIAIAAAASTGIIRPLTVLARIAGTA